jgi:hypothetical protein
MYFTVDQEAKKYFGIRHFHSEYGRCQNFEFVKIFTDSVDNAMKRWINEKVVTILSSINNTMHNN